MSLVPNPHESAIGSDEGCCISFSVQAAFPLLRYSLLFSTLSSRPIPPSSLITFHFFTSDHIRHQRIHTDTIVL